jgi:hypothetical protein
MIRIDETFFLELRVDRMKASYTIKRSSSLTAKV